jgi:regulator of sigma E protease
VVIPDGLEAGQMMFFEAVANFPYLTLAFYVVAFVVAISCIVFVHEFGHFIVGRWCGVNVEAFAVGFGKELLGFTDRRGTRWKLCALPIGGYVKFEGDANAASVPDPTVKHAPTSLHGRPVLQRMAIVAAGPIANFILAIAIFAMSYGFMGISYMRPTVDVVVAGSAAEKAGIKPGDKVLKIEDKVVVTFQDIIETVLFRPGEQLAFEIERAGEIITLQATPEAKDQPDNFGGSNRIGMLGVRHNKQADEPLYRTLGPAEALSLAVDRTWFISSTTLKQFGLMLIGERSFKQVGGPVSMGKVAGDAASEGVPYFIMALAFLSVSIGLVNLFPIPMLDGGHLVFYAIEAVRGKPLGPVAQEWGFRIGFTCVVMLMLLGIFNDAGRSINVAFPT